VIAAAATPEPIESYKVISERNLFGTTDKILAAKPAAASRGTSGQMDITSTLEVRGTVAGDCEVRFCRHWRIKP